MKILIYSVLLPISLFVLLHLIGLMLPQTRRLSKTNIFDTPIDRVYQTITDNQHWQYRSSLDNLQIISQEKDKEIWLETTGKITIRFITLEKREPEYYAFKMEHQLFHGTWTAKLEAISANRTLFTATEDIHYKNPIIRLIAYALMDLDTAMQTYQDDLGKELKRRQTASTPDFSDDQLH